MNLQLWMITNWRFLKRKFKLRLVENLVREKNRHLTLTGSMGNCDLALFIHALKYSRFSGVSRWRGMNFNYIWIMYSQSALSPQHNPNTQTLSFQFTMRARVKFSVGPEAERYVLKLALILNLHSNLKSTNMRFSYFAVNHNDSDVQGR